MYSNTNTAWDNLQRSRHDARIQWEIEYAAALRDAFPEISRGAALKQAAQAYDRARS